MAMILKTAQLQPVSISFCFETPEQSQGRRNISHVQLEARYLNYSSEGNNALVSRGKYSCIRIMLFVYTTLLEKYPTLILFCENLVDFNEARSHEATLNLQMHTYYCFILLCCFCILLCQESIRPYFYFAKTQWFSVKRACMRRH